MQTLLENWVGRGLGLNFLVTDVPRNKPDPGLGAVGVQGLWPCPALPVSSEGARRRESEFPLTAIAQPLCKGIFNFPLGTVL